MVAVCTVVNERPFRRDSMTWLVACSNPLVKNSRMEEGLERCIAASAVPGFPVGLPPRYQVFPCANPYPSRTAPAWHVRLSAVCTYMNIVADNSSTCRTLRGTPLSSCSRGLLLRVSHCECFFEASSLLGIGLLKTAPPQTQCNADGSRETSGAQPPTGERDPMDPCPSPPCNQIPGLS